jgi:hypothetical protein
MPAYARFTVGRFIHADIAAIVGSLQQAYAADGFATQYTRQTIAWARAVPELQHTFVEVLKVRPEADDWTILLEFPLYRMRRRIDVVILAGSLVIVVECKVGVDVFTSEDRRQVEEYALDLRDFHAGSHGRRIIPLLWITDAKPAASSFAPGTTNCTTMEDVVQIGAGELSAYLSALALPDGNQA